MKMNVKAEQFVPESQKLEDALFDALEKQFVKNNPWLFEFEYGVEKRFNQGVSAPPPTPVFASPRKRKFEQISYSQEPAEKVVEKEKQKPSYAAVVKGSK